MNEPLMPPGDDEGSQVFQIVQQYLQQIEAGEHPSRAELELRYPDLIATMEPYLDAIEMLHAAAPQLRDRSGAAGEHAASAAPLPEGKPLGDFQLVREIGRGGMGVVYEAVQLSLSRKVAVKVLPFAAALDARQLQRFRNEAQAAASLHHPHIVPVYGVGCERGVHFYVMQLIEGQNLASFISRLQEEAEVHPATVFDSSSAAGLAEPQTPVKRELPAETGQVFSAELTTQRVHRKGIYYRTVAEMIVQAADALDYAHSLGIVHRDVKPANIIVDDGGKVWVADFGLAQIQTDQTLTHTGDLLGTLRYMSPEQAGGQPGQVDHRTDVYSLGATLYELLTLRPLFEAENRRGLLHRILEEEPRSVRSFDRLIPRELDIITRRSLGKSPGDRYDSIREMREDLQRFLKDLPIRARTPSLLERLAKWSRRHRGIVVSGVAALALTVAGLSVATWMTAAAYDRERAKAAEAALQHERAERNFQQARAAVDEFTRIADETLGSHPVMETARLRMLETALTYYQNFIDQHRDDATLQGELEVSLAKVELILNEMTTLIEVGKYRLLQYPQVQRELKLTAEQQASLQTVVDLWHEMLHDKESLGRTQREQRRLELARRQDAEVKRVLTPEQQERFQQIAWREAGPLALEDGPLSGKLELTAEQRGEIRRLLAEYLPPRPGPPPFRPPPERELSFSTMAPPPGPPPPYGPGEEFARGNIERVNKELEKVLSAEQQARWQKLLGEPLTEPLQRLPPPLPAGGFRFHSLEQGHHR
ncbi:serine/threonine protein kinase [Planctomicrobium sp. SH661]|uniref:serine/threonine protein kinase n=1 Tax=Planctomicrobium sp. SH661 TaxID=3448124 RepID=UPI003F5C964C